MVAAEQAPADTPVVGGPDGGVAVVDDDVQMS